MASSLGIARHVRNGVRYAAMGIVILAAWNLFAPFIGMLSWAPYLDTVPVIVGQTEREAVWVNATHVIVFSIAAVVVMKA